MIAITKDEAVQLRKRFKSVCIVRLCAAKSKRHHYVVEEVPSVLETVAELRGCKVADLITD